MHKRKNNLVTYLIVVLIILILVIAALFNNPDANESANNVVLLTLSEQDEPIVWNNLKLSVGQQEGPGDYVSIPNHSEITATESITLPAGEATMIRFVHGGSAVNPVPDVVMYWIYIQRPIQGKPDMMRTYYLEGQVVGDNEQQAREQFVQFAQSWEVD